MWSTANQGPTRREEYCVYKEEWDNLMQKNKDMSAALGRIEDLINVPMTTENACDVARRVMYEMREEFHVLWERYGPFWRY